MSQRWLYSIAFLTIVLLLLFSVYLQIFKGVIPCPLCTLQRLTFGLLGIIFVIGVLVARFRISRFVINGCAAFTSLLGIFLAGRQIWLQHFPSAATEECGVSIQYMMQILPLREVIPKIFQGSVECSQQGWSFFYLDMAEWAFIWFGIFLTFALYSIAKDYRKNNR